MLVEQPKINEKTIETVPSTDGIEQGMTLERAGEIFEDVVRASVLERMAAVSVADLVTSDSRRRTPPMYSTTRGAAFTLAQIKAAPVPVFAS